MPSDVGKPCTDSKQCEQMCYINVDELPKSPLIEGKCSGGMSHWGVEIKEVKNGKVSDGRGIIVM